MPKTASKHKLIDHAAEATDALIALAERIEKGAVSEELFGSFLAFNGESKATLDGGRLMEAIARVERACTAAYGDECAWFGLAVLAENIRPEDIYDLLG